MCSILLAIVYNNARVCSHHFKEDDFIKKLKLEGFTHRQELNDDSVLTVFSFCTPANRSKLNMLRQLDV